MTTHTTTRRPPAGLARAVLAAALALAALGAGPGDSADALGRVCPPSSPNCAPEATAGDHSGYGGLGPARIGGVCRPSSPNCGPDTVARGGWPDGTPGNTSVKCPSGQPSCDPEN